MKNFYLVISGICAVATVLLSAVQTFSIVPASAPVAPVVEQAAPKEEPKQPQNQLVVAKLEPAPEAEISSSKLVFMRGTRDGIVDRYRIADLFDEDAATVLSTAEGEHEIDFIAELQAGQAANFSGLEYSHPNSANADQVATQIDLIVLPEGGLEGGGREVQSFAIAPQKGPQRFSMPGSRGKGVWLRIAGSQSGPNLAVGNVRIIASQP